MHHTLPKIGSHYRVPWRATDPRHIMVHARLDQIKGTSETGAERTKLGERYERAKRRYDVASAAEIVDEWLSGHVITTIARAVIEANKPGLVVAPHPDFDEDCDFDPEAQAPTNAIPSALAARVAVSMGCGVDDNIVEVARPGRTKLKLFPRFLWQPRFEGEVSLDHAYILVDDVCTMGGTLAALRSHIVERGGTVVAASTLAHSQGGAQFFPIEQATLNVLLSTYGPDLDTLWQQEIGHGIRSLTDGEGCRLLEWSRANLAGCTGSAAVQRIRGRLAEAAGTAC